jgi:hypothetical protein
MLALRHDRMSKAWCQIGHGAAGLAAPPFREASTAATSASAKRRIARLTGCLGSSCTISTPRFTVADTSREDGIRADKLIWAVFSTSEWLIPTSRPTGSCEVSIARTAVVSITPFNGTASAIVCAGNNCKAGATGLAGVSVSCGWR